MKIEFCDLKKQYKILKEKIDSKIQLVLDNGNYIGGEEIRELEKKCAKFVNAKHAIGVSSGTDALFISLLAKGIKKGDYIITTPFTFISSAEVIELIGARTIFVDIDPKTFNIDAEKIREFLENPIDQKSKEKIEIGKIKGIITVDVFGQPADYDEIRKIIGNKDIFILEDGAQSFGAKYRNRMACSLGDISITSFFPSKPLGCYGDGGMIFTDDSELAEKIKMIRNHGQKEKYQHNIIGLNGRLDTIQAAILLAKFDFFVKKEINMRKRNSQLYSEKLKNLFNSGKLVPQLIEKNVESIYAQYSLKISDNLRNDLINYLKERGIPVALHYPKPLHLQEAFKHLNYTKGDFPVSENVSRNVISLPFDAWKDKEEIDYICGKINDFYRS